MLIRAEITEEIASPLGLKPALLERLGQRVVLAGPNGGGKSRFLQAVINSTQAARNAIKSHRDSRQNTWLTADRRAAFENTTRAAVASISDDPALRVDVVSLAYPVAPPELENLARLTPASLKDKAKQAYGRDFGSTHRSMHAYVADHARALREAKHPDSANDDVVQQAGQRAKDFDKMLTTLLGRSLTHRYDGAVPLPILGDRVFHPGELSEGEKLLLTWAIMFFEQGVNLDGAIVFLDEPDVHLHPDACIQALSRLQAALGPRGQMWIATHSVPLIANFGFDTLFYVHDNTIEPASRKADEVVKSLLGGEQARDKLRDFLVDADQLAQVRFLLECLLPAGVAPSTVADPQQLQFSALVARRVAAGKPVRVLDFAAGKGRFAKALRDWLTEHGRQASEIDYHAFHDQSHLDESSVASCKQEIGALGLDAEKHVWFKMSELKTNLGGEFDLIVMCNVLHEIPYRDWPKVMADTKELLNTDGTLVVMEDLFPSVGELPHPDGFLVLDDVALMELMGSPKAVACVLKYKRRVMVAEVPKAAIGTTRATVDKAIEKVKEQALEQITRIRQVPTPTAADGREHAVWAMQYTNASLAAR
jgi:predicted ATPase